MRSQRQQARMVSVQNAAVIVAILAIVLVPLYWMLLTAIKPNSELYHPSSLLWVRNPTLAHFQELFTTTPFLIQARNSLMVASIATVVTTITSTLAAYSLARLNYPGRSVAAAAVFFSYLVPPTLLFIPMYSMWAGAGLINTPWVLVLSYLTLTVPFCTWMLRGYFHTIPRDLEEAARVDGCSRLQTLWLIVVPLAAPGIVASALFAFTLAWNEYLYAFIFTSQATVTTAPVGLASLIMGDVFLWGQIMAGAVVMAIPILLIYVFGQRFIVGGMTAGAVKG